MSDSTQDQTPSLIGGHAQFVKGKAEQAIGSVTGSEAWTQSGDKDASEGVDTMKAAGQNRDPQAQGFGKVEELAGKAVGCEGMENEGVESKK